MRRFLIPLFLLLLALPQTAMAVGVTLTAQKAQVLPGGANRLTLVITNIGATPLSGRLQYDVVSNSASLLDASADNAAVKCALTAESGPLFYRCTADPITLAPGASVTTNVDVFVPASTAPGTEIRSEARVVMQTSQGGFEETVSTTFLVAAAGAPVLKIDITRTNVNDTLTTFYVASYDIVVTNVGTAPTTGPIVMDGTWQGTSSVEIADHDTILQPTESFQRVVAGFVAQARGDYEFTVVASGGAPRAQKTDVLTLDPRLPIRLLGLPPVMVLGRRR